MVGRLYVFLECGGDAFAPASGCIAGIWEGLGWKVIGLWWSEDSTGLRIRMLWGGESKMSPTRSSMIAIAGGIDGR